MMKWGSVSRSRNERIWRAGEHDHATTEARHVAQNTPTIVIAVEAGTLMGLPLKLWSSQQPLTTLTALAGAVGYVMYEALLPRIKYLA